LLFLIDTNVFSDLMEDSPRVTAKLAAVASGDRVCTSAIVRGEILYGIVRLSPGKKRDSLQIRADGLFGFISCQPISEGVADRYALIKREMASRGASLAENDLWIAATASNLGATLVTRDRAFRRIPDLAIDDWSA
jgi:tRNA(fMet)-specific endonuclease VapC